MRLTQTRVVPLPVSMEGRAPTWTMTTPVGALEDSPAADVSLTALAHPVSVLMGGLR